MEYRIKTDELDELTDVIVGIESGNPHYHNGIDYIVEKIRITNPENGVIHLFCSKDMSTKNFKLRAKIT